jgi:hypothetical protein
MSAERKMRRQREIAERKRMEKVALKVARESGCVCGPRVEATKLQDRFHGVRVFHSDFCPLLRAVQETANPNVITGPVVIVPDAWEPT